AHAHMHLVGSLVGGKASVAVDSKKGAPRGMRIGHQPRAYLVQRPAQFRNKPQAGIAHHRLVTRLVGLKPLAVVAPFQLLQEIEQLRSEITLAHVIQPHSTTRQPHSTTPFGSWFRLGCQSPSISLRTRLASFSTSLLF